MYYRVPMEEWLRMAKRWGPRKWPASLARAENEFPFLKDARFFLNHTEYRALVGAINPEYRNSVRVTDGSDGVER